MLTESVYVAGTILPRHSHANALFNFVVAGSYQERLGRREVTRSRSTLLFLPSDLTHEEVHSVAGRRFIIEVDAAYCRKFGKEPASLNAPLDLSGGEGRRIVMRMYQEFSNSDNLSHLVLEGLGLELLTLTVRRWNAQEFPPTLHGILQRHR